MTVAREVALSVDTHLTRATVEVSAAFAGLDTGAPFASPPARAVEIGSAGKLDAGPCVGVADKPELAVIGLGLAARTA